MLFAVNAPYWDDFDAILGFVLRFEDAPDTPSKLLQIFDQHNEHRIVFTKIVSLVCFTLFGGLDFNVLIALGLLGLVLLAPLLYWLCGSCVRTPWLLAPAFYLVYQAQHWENLTWAMAGLQNFWSMTFAMLSVLCAVRREWRWFWAAFAWSCAAVLTSGTGLALLPTVFCSFVFSGRKREAALWAALSAALLVGYFAMFRFPTATSGGISALLDSPLMYARHYLSVLGAAPAALHVLAAPLGALILANGVSMLWGGYSKRNPALFWMYVFLLAVGALVSWSRAQQGLMQAFSSRYMIISSLLFALGYLSLLERASARIVRWAAPCVLALAVLFNAATYVVNVKHLEKRRSELTTGIRRWAENERGLSHPLEEHSAALMRAALEKGVYIMPEIHPAP